MPDGLNQILSNGLWVLPKFSEARVFLEGAGLDKSLIRTLEDEDKFSSEYLLSLTNEQLSDTELEKQLRLFLKKRWALIHRTNGSYNCIPHSPVNQLCIQLAEAMAGENEPIVTILCPTLSIKEDDYLTGETLIQQTEFMKLRKTQKIIKLRKPMDLNDPDGPKEYVENVIEDDEYDRVRRLNPYAFFISNDGRAVINIKSWFEFQDIKSGSPNRNHLYLEHKKVVTLYDLEFNMLMQCALPYSEELFDQFAIISKLESAQGTMAASMSRLVMGLKVSGVAGEGTHALASETYIDYVKSFAKDLLLLSKEDREEVLEMTAPDLFKFSHYWGAVSGEDRVRSDVLTCTDFNSEQIKSILLHNIARLSSLELTRSPSNVEVDLLKSPFELVKKNILDKIKLRVDAYKEYMSESSDIAAKQKAGQDAVKLLYDSKSNEFDKQLDTFKLDVRLNTITRVSSKSLDYFQRMMGEEEFNNLYYEQNESTRIDFLRHSIKQSPWAALNIMADKRFVVPRGVPLIHYAVESGSQELVTALMLKGLSINKAVDHLTPVQYAAILEDSDMLSFLVKSNADIVHQKIGPKKIPLLSYAVLKGWVDVSMEILEKYNFDLMNELDNQGVSTFEYVIRNGAIIVLTKMISQGISLDKEFKGRVTPLHIAARYGHIDVMRKIHQVNPQMIDKKDALNCTPIVEAILYHQMGAFDYLLDQNPDLQNVTKEGLTLIDCALRYENHRCAAQLILKGAPIPLLISRVKVPLLHYAISRGWQDVNEAIISRKNKSILNQLDAEKNSAFNHAIEKNDKELIEKLLNAGADPNLLYSIPSFKQVLLKKYPPVTEYVVNSIIENGILNKIDSKGLSFLMMAAIHGNSDVVKELVENGAYVNAVDGQGFSALYHAAANRHGFVVLSLLEKGARFNGMTIEGMPLLIYCIKKGWTKCAIFLIENEADLRVSGADHKNVLELAINSRSPELLSAVLKAMPDAKDIFSPVNGVPLIHRVSATGLPVMIDVVLKYYEQLNIEIPVRDSFGRTPLHLAAGSKNIGAVQKVLLTCKSKPNDQDNNGHTPLHFALVGHPDSAVVNALLNEGAKVDIKDNAGDTPLSLMISSEHFCWTKTYAQCFGDMFFANDNIKDNDEIYAKLRHVPYFDPILLIFQRNHGTLEACPQLHLILESAAKEHGFDKFCFELSNPINPCSAEALRLYAASIASKLEYEARHGRGTDQGATKAECIRQGLNKNDMSIIVDALKLNPQPRNSSRFWKSPVHEPWEDFPEQVKSYINMALPGNQPKNK